MKKLEPRIGDFVHQNAAPSDLWEVIGEFEDGNLQLRLLGAPAGGSSGSLHREFFLLPEAWGWSVYPKRRAQLDLKDEFQSDLEEIVNEV